MNIPDENCRRLMSLVAHELRSPGAVVSGYLRLLARNTAPSLSEPERRMIDEANKSCGRLLNIASELSELAELSSDDPVRSRQQVPIFSLCGDVVQAAADAGAVVSFSMDERDKGACVEGEAGRLRQALGLLVSVVGRERGATAMTVTGAVSRASESRAVVVLGEAADAADLNAVIGASANAFDRWRGGTGLSLPIACRIIEAHHGTVWALPSGSRGSCALSLPLGAAV
jgi:two-component system OmpR family sensor kinase